MREENIKTDLKEKFVNLWTGSVWLRMRTSGGFL
jgi:hypothetical protein